MHGLRSSDSAMRPFSPRTHTASALISALVAAAGVHLPQRVDASLLDEPPKVFTFDLGEAGAARLPLLSVMQNASVERPGPFRLYMHGRWADWQDASPFELRWSGDDDGAASFWWGREVAPHAAARDPFLLWSFRAAPIDELVLARSPGHARRLARAVSPAWMTRLDPTFASPILASTGVGSFTDDAGLASNGFDVLWSLPPLDPVVDWRCRRRPIQFIRYEGEHDRFDLVSCAGSVEPGALDRLSIIARPPGVPRSADTLPDEPDPSAWKTHREWIDGVRIMHPRLLWVLQQIADAYPNRGIYVISGYRRPGEDPEGGSAHRSLHHEGRAMDLIVHGIDNADVFKTCRTLKDAGCGYYPNSRFVHVDARPANSGKAFWIDISHPGEPTEYVDAWPGVVDGGAMVWMSSRSGP
jgi:hypothetical protein